MCLAIPAKVIEVKDGHAIVDSLGIRHKVNIMLVEKVIVSEFVLVHAGFAIQKIDVEYFDFLQETLSEMINNKDEE